MPFGDIPGSCSMPRMCWPYIQVPQHAPWDLDVCTYSCMLKVRNPCASHAGALHVRRHPQMVSCARTKSHAISHCCSFSKVAVGALMMLAWPERAARARQARAGARAAAGSARAAGTSSSSRRARAPAAPAGCGLQRRLDAVCGSVHLIHPLLGFDFVAIWFQLWLCLWFCL